MSMDRTEVVVDDDELVNHAQRLSGLPTFDETVALALREFIARRAGDSSDEQWR